MGELHVQLPEPDPARRGHGRRHRAAGRAVPFDRVYGGWWGRWWSPTARARSAARRTATSPGCTVTPGVVPTCLTAGMDLPVMPPVAPMLAKAGRARCPTRRRAALRAEVGRLPLHRVPRRRRGRARQPQRAAADPLLPGARRAAARGSCPSAAWSTARSSSPRGDGLDFEALLQRIHPAAVAGRRMLAEQTPASLRRLRPARARRRGAAGRRRSRERRARLDDGARPAPGRRCTSPPATDRRRRGAGLVRRASRAPASTAWSPSAADRPYQPGQAG